MPAVSRVVKRTPFRSRYFSCLFPSVALILAAIPCHAQQAVTYQIVHNFGGTITNSLGKSGPDGADPSGQVSFDQAGNMYGTAATGGAYNGGVLWEITSSGTYKDLHDFGGTVVNQSGTAGKDGSGPSGAVSFDSAGNMFGTTETGGPNDPYKAGGSGIVWELTKGGVYKDLHDFGGTLGAAKDGSAPTGRVSIDSSGDLFGTTHEGGSSEYNGTVWEISKAGTYSLLHEFGGTTTLADGSTGSDGASPSNTTMDGEGNLYGTANAGGQNREGTIWEVTKAGTYKDIHDFGGMINGNLDGGSPEAGVTFDSAGDMFGETYGMIWEIPKSGSYTQLLYLSLNTTNANGTTGRNGDGLNGEVCVDSTGNLFGTTLIGGESAMNNAYGDGMFWELTSSGNYVDLHDFGGTEPNPGGPRAPDGSQPQEGPAFDMTGSMYGTLSLAGAYQGGIVYKLSLRPIITSVSLSPSTVIGGSTSSGTVTLSGPAASQGQWVDFTVTSADASAPTGVYVVPGATTATFTVHTERVASSKAWTITGTEGKYSASATLQIQAAAPSGLTISPNSTGGGGQSAGTVTLNGPAPDGGLVVHLSSSSSSAGVPATVTILSGHTFAAFKITTTAVTTKTTVTITAAVGSVSKTATLTLNP